MMMNMDYDNAKFGYAERVWDAIRLVTESISDLHTFTTSLDALESILMPAMTQEEFNKLLEIKSAQNKVLDYLYDEKEEIKEEIERNNEILAGTDELSRIEREIDNAIYHANLLRFRHLSSIAYRIFVMRESYSDKPYDVSEEIRDYVESFIGSE